MTGHHAFLIIEVGSIHVAENHWTYHGRELTQLKRAAQFGCTSQGMGREVVVSVTNGRLDFGTWERIFYGAFDG